MCVCACACSYKCAAICFSRSFQTNRSRLRKLHADWRKDASKLDAKQTKSLADDLDDVFASYEAWHLAEKYHRPQLPTVSNWHTIATNDAVQYALAAVHAIYPQAGSCTNGT